MFEPGSVLVNTDAALVYVKWGARNRSGGKGSIWEVKVTRDCDEMGAKGGEYLRGVGGTGGKD